MSTVGVVVGRFQVDSPHHGHRALLEQVRQRNDKVLICLGAAPVPMTMEDPLDYETRKKMMSKAFPWAHIARIDDCPSDRQWSTNLDILVSEIFPKDTAYLYGSRDSFTKHYFGKLPVLELPEVFVDSGTDVRKRIAGDVRGTADFRRGVIYATYNRFPISYQVTDMAVIRKSGEVTEVLLGKKVHDTAWRFIGGFVDTDDPTLEFTARREVLEETGIEAGKPVYLGSCRIDDWRYRGRKDQIMTAFYVMPYIFGMAKANDDIAVLKWMPVSELPGCLISAHQEMGQMLIDYLAKTQPDPKGGSR